MAAFTVKSPSENLRVICACEEQLGGVQPETIFPQLLREMAEHIETEQKFPYALVALNANSSFEFIELTAVLEIV